MPENGIGRVLVASLHQGIADILPNTLEPAIRGMMEQGMEAMKKKLESA